MYQYVFIGPWLDPAPSCTGCTNSAGLGHGRSPRTGFPLTEMGNQDGCVDNRVAIHGERNGAGGPGMVQYSLQTLQHRSPTHPSSL